MPNDVKYSISLQDKFSSKMGAIQKRTQSFDKTIGRTIGRFAGFAAVGAVLTSSIKKMADFEEQVSNLSAITGATGQDLEFLKNKAIELGGATTKSAEDTVKAFKLIASAKPELLSNGAALAKVTKEAITLSEASGLELPAAATALTDAMNQFGLAADQSGRVINLLAAGSKFAAAEIPDLTMSLKEFGGVADSLGISIEESAAAVETLSSKGLKGSRAGMNLRNVFLKLGASTDRNLNPKIVGLSKALENLAPIQDNTNELTKMFGRQNVLAAQTIIKQRDRLDELTESMTGTNIAYEQARVNTDNLNSDVARLSSSWEKFVLNMDRGSGTISKALRGTVQLVTKLIDALDELNKTEEQRTESRSAKLVEGFKEKSLSTVKTEAEFQNAIAESRKRAAHFLEQDKQILEDSGRKELKKAKNLLSIEQTLTAAMSPKRVEKAKRLIEAERSVKAYGEYIRKLDKMGREGFKANQNEITTDAVVDESGLKKVTDQVTKITSAAPKVFNINIAKFVENFSVNSETVEGSESDVMNFFKEGMIRMLADVQAVGA